MIADIMKIIESVSMSIRLPPSLLVRIDWTDPLNDPVFRQFIPMQSAMINDHPKMMRDSLGERDDAGEYMSTNN